jgi:hypothetical protein
MDTIEIGPGQFSKMHEWFHMLGDEWEKELIHYPLEEGVIKFHTDNMQTSEDPNAPSKWESTYVYLHFKIKDGVQYFEYQDRGIFLYRWTVERTQKGTVTYVHPILQKALTHEEMRNNMKFFSNVFLITMVYLLLYRNNVEGFSQRNIRVRKEKKGKKGKGKRVIYVNRRVYTIHVPSNATGRKNQRHIEAWNVAGHWRTYKSGKKAWIPPHKRGKGKTESKTYKI